jgi:hypothetical protein
MSSRRLSVQRRAALRPIMQRALRKLQTKLEADEVATVGVKTASEINQAMNFCRSRLSRDDYEQLCKLMGWSGEGGGDERSDCTFLGTDVRDALNPIIEIVAGAIGGNAAGAASKNADLDAVANSIVATIGGGAVVPPARQGERAHRATGLSFSLRGSLHLAILAMSVCQIAIGTA